MLSVLRSKKDWPHSLLGLGSLAARFRAAGENCDGEIGVVDERRPQRDRAPRVARRRREGGEIARQHRCRGNELEEAGRRHVDARRLVAGKVEELSRDDRSAERPAELIAAQAVAAALAVRTDGGEGVGGIQRIVAHEFEAAAVQQVGARLGDGVDRGRRVVAVLRRESARLDLELLHCVGKRQRQVQVVHRLVVRASVEDVGHSVRQPACHHDGRVGIAADAAVQRVGARCVAGALAAGREAGLEHQLRQLPAVERQLEHLLIRDDLSDAGVPRLDQRRAALDRHGLLELPELERDGERRDSPRPARQSRSARRCGSPGSVASSRYGPTGRFCSTYDPVSSVTAVRVNPVSVLVAVMVTPGSGRDAGSLTVPLICAVAAVWADAAVNETRTIRSPRTVTDAAWRMCPPRKVDPEA